MPRVALIRGLLDAGLPVRIIRQLPPCLDTPWTIYCPNPTPEMTALLQRERDRMTERIDCLVRNRDAMAAYLEQARGGGAGGAGATAPAVARAGRVSRRDRAGTAMTARWRPDGRVCRTRHRLESPDYS